ncbi:MAG: FAD-binding protein [Mycobacteriales bacterium]
MSELCTDVLVVGSGAAGMFAAIEATRRGADVLLVDKSMVGAGGATVMAQMTVAAALGHQEPDSADLHFSDTVEGGKGLVDEPLARLLCEDAPKRILETRSMRVNWAADGDRLRQVSAPGHSRARCCYVDVLATGTGVARGLKTELRRLAIARHPNVFVTELIKNSDGRVAGAAALDVRSGEPLRIWARAVVLACGGLTELYLRNSASVNMTGDAYALGLKAGAELIDIEMVQFFPIANLAPRMIGLDPIMWDPFRYKLGGRLTNGLGEEFIERYAGEAEGGRYTTTRDVLSYAILKEVEAGRGSPSGGAYLDFQGCSAQEIHDAFPPVVEKLLAQGVDLTMRAVEVAPSAHYTIGGLRVDGHMHTTVPGLLAAGEAAGGAHGANRLSGNAISEAFVFGARAGITAAGEVGEWGIDPVAVEHMAQAELAILRVPARNPSSRLFLPALRTRLQSTMWTLVGPFRDEARLTAAAAALDEIDAAVDAARVGDQKAHNLEWVEWLEMKNMVLTARAVRTAALERRESRGAHQREDFPGSDSGPASHGIIAAEEEGLRHRWVDVVTSPTLATV